MVNREDVMTQREKLKMARKRYGKHLEGLTIQDIIDRNRETGHYFFDKKTMRVFNSRTSERVYAGPGGVFIVTSERNGWMAGAQRMYSVRQFDWITGSVSTIHWQTSSMRLAHKAALQDSLA